MYQFVYSYFVFLFGILVETIMNESAQDHETVFGESVESISFLTHSLYLSAQYIFVILIITVIKVIEKQWTGTVAIKRQIPLLKPKQEINKRRQNVTKITSQLDRCTTIA